jgi:hypothetical protein
MLKGILGLAGAAALSGCASVAANGGGLPLVQTPQSVSYETGPCFGACPVYRVTVRTDGTGVFEGRRFTSVEGERRFTVTPAQYNAFVAQLAPVRPARGDVRYDPSTCGSFATDLPTVQVAWSEGADSQSLYYNHGCDMEKNRALSERLRDAPKLLPIADFILAPGAQPFTGKGG